MLTITSHRVEGVIAALASQEPRQKDRQAANYHAGDR